MEEVKSPERSINVSGAGRLSVSPDTVVLTMKIEGKSKSYEKALADAAGRIESLRGAVVSAGHRTDDLKTARFNVRSDYNHVQDRKEGLRRVFVGYVCEYSLTLTFAFEQERLAATMAAVAAAKAEPETDIRFTVADPEAVREQLLAGAADNARRKAEALCRASGVRLGRLLRIGYRVDRSDFVSDTECGNAVAMPMMAKGIAADMVPEDIELSDSASFVWAIED